MLKERLLLPGQNNKELKNKTETEYSTYSCVINFPQPKFSLSILLTKYLRSRDGCVSKVKVEILPKKSAAFKTSTLWRFRRRCARLIRELDFPIMTIFACLEKSRKNTLHIFCY